MLNPFITSNLGNHGFYKHNNANMNVTGDGVNTMTIAVCFSCWQRWHYSNVPKDFQLTSTKEKTVV